MDPTPRESPTQALYRAALGPLQTAHHLRAFERFDADGAARPGWNWAAALLTLDWLAYRRLWRIAGLYLLLWGGALGLLLGWAWGRWPPGVTLGLLAAAGALAIAVPGLYADAWLHGQVRRAVVAAVSAAPSLADACDALRRRAPSLARFGVLVLLNLLLAAGAAAWWWPGRGPVVEPESVAMQAVPAAPAAAVAVAPVAESEPAAPVPVPVPDPAPAPVSVPTPVAESAPEPTVAPRAEAPPPPPSRDGRHVVNVGLFADPANAERVAARLKSAGLPVMQDTLAMPSGPRVRVRVGPLSGRAQADQAAQRIRALGLEAQVSRQGAGEQIAR